VFRMCTKWILRAFYASRPVLQLGNSVIIVMSCKYKVKRNDFGSKFC